MILTDREIQLALEHKAILIDPLPSEQAYSSTSVDLTLDRTLSVYKPETRGLDRIADPGLADFDHEAIAAELLTTVRISSDGFVFKPGYLALAWTKEYIELKAEARLAARVEGKSSLARYGIVVHMTAPVIHAGFPGQIRLEMFNHGNIPVRLRAGMRICQLVFEQTLGTPVRGYKGRFSGQTASRKKG
jgi:dCTP deaminase